MSIDRLALVRRHDPRVTWADPRSALSLGNGGFAVTADVTGLQTFADDYEATFPLCILANWGWHERPLPPGMAVTDLRWTEHRVGDRLVPYPQEATGQEALFAWMNENPHRLNCGRVGFRLVDAQGRRATLADLSAIEQRLDLWNGQLESRFTVFGATVVVRTCVHPDQDTLAVHIDSTLLASRQLQIELSFPWHDRPRARAAAPPVPDHSTPVVDTMRWTQPQAAQLVIDRQCDAMRYQVSFTSPTLAAVSPDGTDRLRIALNADAPGSGRAEFLLRFAPQPAPRAGAGAGIGAPAAAAHPSPPTATPSVTEAFQAATAHWNGFWSSGGAIQLIASRDPRARELERRVVLSQYLTAIQSCGELPPQETGLTCNSWAGKFHLEMHWWHSVHFVSWGRFHHFEATLPLYHRLLPQAEATARRQGYPGARWMKMIGPDGVESPNACGPFLIWQQPHPIYYAELVYRHRPTADTLARWWPIVRATAAFMAGFAHWDAASGRYILPPPLVPVSENLSLDQCRNPAFELAYWRFGLRTALRWCQRLGLEPDPLWPRVLAHVAEVPQEDGVYLIQEGLSESYTRYPFDHPALLGCLGFLPGDDVDRDTMRRTLARVWSTWTWNGTWGWDFPLAAFTAARCGEPGLAVDILLRASSKNTYLPNGHNYQFPDLPLYLPGNGGLLTAVAMMAAGWDGSHGAPSPGFPQDGSWTVEHEGLVPMLG